MNVKVIFGALIAVVAGLSLLAAKEAGVGPFDTSLAATLPKPANLVQTNTAHGWTIRPGEWMKTDGVTLSAAQQPAQHYQLQVQVSAGGAGPSNMVTQTSSAASQSANLRVSVPNLSNGAYRWWARYYDGKAVSPWVPFSPGAAFGIDTSAVAAPAVSSSSYPGQTTVYRSPKGSFSWTAPTTTSGVKGYWYQVLPKGTPLPKAFHLVTTSTNARLPKLATGSYTFAVAARNVAGTWGKAATYQVRLDTTPPTMTRWGFSIFAFNPKFDSTTVYVRVDRPAHVRIGIYRESDGGRVRLVTRHTSKPDTVVQYTWHGQSHARDVSAGLYTFVVRTTDHYGNSSVATIPQHIGVTYKRIMVSLSQQKLWAYDGNKLEWSSLVTTGNVSELPTPAGHFQILDMRHPFVFHSESPPGSPYWYPDSPVQYAMLFKFGGYYIHDAPWRTAFGPGTNLVPGKPGSPDTGTHGCINVPDNTAAWLFNWSIVGLPVIVQP